MGTRAQHSRRRAVLVTSAVGACLVCLLVWLLLSQSPTEKPLRSGHTWSGYAWSVRDGGGTPGPCRWDPRNAAVDSHGHLHLKLTQTGGTWSCAEIHSLVATGYGTYTWRILSDLRGLSPSVVLGMFTYDPRANESTGNSEIDIEATRWGHPSRNNVEYSIQPTGPDPTGRQKAFALGRPPYVARFTWTSARVAFAVTDANGHPHSFTSTVLPAAPTATTRAYINLWLFHSQAPAHPLDITLGSFSYARAPNS
jgi:hypothetical protein